MNQGDITRDDCMLQGPWPGKAATGGGIPLRLKTSGPVGKNSTKNLPGSGDGIPDAR